MSEQLRIVRIMFVFVCVGWGHLQAESKAANCAFEDSFEAADVQWVVEQRDGAEGVWGRDETRGRTGKSSFRISKTNSVGCLVLRTVNPVKLSLGTQYSFLGHFHADNAPLSSLLLFRLGNKDSANFGNPYGLYHYIAEGHIPNAPAGHWEKRIANYLCSRDESPDVNMARNVPEMIYPHIILYGNPATVWLDDISIAVARSSNKTDRDKYNFPYTKEDVLRILTDRQATSIAIRPEQGRMVFEKDGKPIPPALYLASENNELVGDFESFGKAGLNLAMVPLPLGFDVSPNVTWKGKGQYDFDKVDEWIINALRKNPYVDLVIVPSVYPYRTWGEEHPDECWRDEKGQVAFDYWAPYLPGGFGAIKGFAVNRDKIPPCPQQPEAKPCLYPSYHSLQWRQDSCEAIKAIVSHIKATPMGKAVVGFMFFGGWDGRWQSDVMDYAPPVTKRFQEYCRHKYETPQRLSAAWGIQVCDFADVTLPAHDRYGVFPGADAKCTPYRYDPRGKDFRSFRREDIWELVDTYAQTAKVALGKPCFMATYRDMEEEFFHTKNLDVNANDFMFYTYRRPGWVPGWLRPQSWFHRKMIFADLDLRTWAGPQIVDEEYEQLIGVAHTPEEWTATNKKLVGMAIARNSGYWYYDMLAYFQDPLIMENIARTQLQVEKLVGVKPKPFRPDVAILLDNNTDHLECSPLYYQVYHNVSKVHYDQAMMLQTSGVPYDVYYLNDLLEHPELQTYKVYVFLHDVFITEAQRQAINRLKGGGRTLVWVYDTGYISEKGKDAEAMSNLIGMTVKTEERFARLTPLMIDGAHPLTKNVLPFQGMSELTYVNFRLKEMAIGGHAPAQPFWVEDEQSQVFCKYREDGKAAMAVKTHPDWTSIYLAAPNSLGNDLFNNIAKEAGAFVYGRPGQLIDMNGNFISIHGLKTENYTLRLPPGTKRLIDADRNRVLAENQKEFDFLIETQKTAWYFLE